MAGQRPNGTFVHSIFTNDSSSSGIGGAGTSMLAMPGFQAHNLSGAEVHNMSQGLTPNSRMANDGPGGRQDNSLLIYGAGPAGTYSHTPAARGTRSTQQPYIPGPHTQTHAAQSSMQAPNFYPPQHYGGGDDSNML